MKPSKELENANIAYANIVKLGPFYGEGDGQAPSFRVSSTPLMLPQHFRGIYTQLGQDIYRLAQVLPKLPDQYTSLIGEDWSPKIPFLWRLDTIIDNENKINVNEVQISDGVDGLITGLQLAYGLNPLDQSPAGHVADYLAARYQNKSDPPKIAFIRHDLSDSPYSSNAKRMHEFLAEASGERVNFTLMDRRQLQTTDWDMFDGVINYAFIRSKDLLESGIDAEKILCVGDACYMGSKGVFALLHDPELNEFWQSQLEPAVLQRLKNHLINSALVQNGDDISKARRDGKVVKVYNTGRLSMIGDGRGVFGPWDTADETWQQVYSSFDNGSKLLTQDFVRPKKHSILLRNRDGSGLEKVEWYATATAKYVVVSPGGNDVALTGFEARLGESENPAREGSCLTTVDFIA
ncbi:MAG: hypothetical protein Q8Q65_04010 [bacterium]|nr:hypothetical protein [bacterium]